MSGVIAHIPARIHRGVTVMPRTCHAHIRTCDTGQVTRIFFMINSHKRSAVHVRSAFLSDIHLGSRECRAELVLDFLHAVQMEQLFLIGDIVDIWSLRRSFYWPQSHNNVLRTILGKAKHGTRVIYVPGNHDEPLREMDGMVFGNLEIHREFVHTTARGLRLLVLHGDEFDSAVKCSRALAAFGSGMYDVALGLNRYVNAARRRLGYPYWSLASYLKSKVGNAMQYVRSFEQAAAHAARRRGLDGIVCGHIHRPEIAERDGVLYCNDGDWVDSCSTLIEDRSGELELWTWNEVGAAVPALRGRGTLGRAA
jgi:UDP-2,3-diacylglucosamine pyrophosphatase LpxH